MLKLELTRQEAEMLQGILASYQFSLQAETWCTETKDAREDVAERDRLVLSLMRRLRAASSPETV